ncbi:MAG: multiheme c-type cytochrome [Xanthomonadales bacterium]|nr:multiheme c-type cytochrome [Xanthomonadales bacterium]
MNWIIRAVTLLILSGPAVAQDAAMGDMAQVKTIEVHRGLTVEGRACVDCHKHFQPGILADWKDSRHAHAGVSCIDCHAVPADSPMAVTHAELGEEIVTVSSLVSPAVCGRCHVKAKAQFDASGHFRSYHQIIPKDNLHALTQVHEGQSHPEFGGAPNETGCMQCHGTKIKLNGDNRPTPDTWPNNGMGNIYPDGATGNCTACHSRHKFSIAEARKPNACASCHLGPDHPNIEIYTNSKHGHIYNTDSDDWNWDTAPDAWEPGDYRAPTCATCHMSGIGDLEVTHNVTERLYWNLWAKESKVRGSDDVLSPILGDGPAGREKMKKVCNNCHSTLHTDGFFTQGDKAVNLYNEAYYRPATAMLEELREKDLLKANPWTDEFQITYYYLWHHQGRRARQGAMMGAADYAHWHGFFELQQDLYKLQQIHKARLESGAIE